MLQVQPPEADPQPYRVPGPVDVDCKAGTSTGTVAGPVPGASLVFLDGFVTVQNPDRAFALPAERLLELSWSDPE